MARKTAPKLVRLHSSARQERMGYAAHYWTIRKDFHRDNPTDIALPRNNLTCRMNGIPTTKFEHVLLIRGVAPDIIISAMIGRKVAEVFDHPMFGPGTKAEHAVIKWAQSRPSGFLVIIVNRPVHPRPTRHGFDYSDDVKPMHPDEDFNRNAQLFDLGLAECSGWAKHYVDDSPPDFTPHPAR